MKMEMYVNVVSIGGKVVNRFQIYIYQAPHSWGFLFVGVRYNSIPHVEIL